MPEALYQLEGAGLDGPREPQWIHSIGREVTGPGGCTGKTQAQEIRTLVEPIVVVCRSLRDDVPGI